MLNILGMIILIIILFIIILLLIGIKISFEYQKKGSKFNGCLKILVFNKISIYSTSFPSQDEDKGEEDSDEEKKQRNIKKILNLAKPCIRDLLDYLRVILNAMSIKTIQNHLIFGLDSYADTGKYIGIIWGILSVVNSFDKNMKLSAEPSFNGSVIDASGVNEFEIYPMKMISPTIGLIRKKEIRQLIRGVWDER